MHVNACVCVYIYNNKNAYGKHEEKQEGGR